MAKSEQRLHGHARQAARHAGSHDTVAVPIPGLSTVHLSRPQLAYVVGLGGLLLWPASVGAHPAIGKATRRGDDENDQWHGNTNHVCLTQLQSASLVVTYY